jgi:mersacidin/lichenicidin family type 2 lantibiotic
MEFTMSRHEIIRAWKDEEYRESLSQAQLVQLPEHPAGLIELTDDQLELVAGGATFRGGSCALLSFGCCDDPN